MLLGIAKKGILDDGMQEMISFRIYRMHNCVVKSIVTEELTDYI